MTRIGLSVETRFLRVPTWWSIKIDPQGIVPGQFSLKDTLERIRRGEPEPPTQLGPVQWFVPQVLAGLHDMERRPEHVDGWKLRDRFLRLKLDAAHEEDVLTFLNDVGVWHAVEDNEVSQASAGKMLLSGAFGSRFFNGRAVPLHLSDLQSEQAHWRELLSSPRALKAEFGSAPKPDATPAKHLAYAVKSHFFNQLPVGIQWRAGLPHGLTETITGREMMTATVQLDLLRGGKFQVCQRPDCGIPFATSSGHPRKYCSWYCGHLESVRRGRKKRGRRNQSAKGE
jgi:CGNR zinc finger